MRPLATDDPIPVSSGAEPVSDKDEGTMMTRCIGAGLLLLAMTSAVSAADVREDQMGRPIPGQRFVARCDDGDSTVVLRCGRRVALPDENPLAAERATIEFSVARHKRPYEQFFSWTR